MTEQLTKKDLNKVLKAFNEITINDIDLEEISGDFSDKADLHAEKDRDEKSERYQELSDALYELASAYQTLQNLLEDHLED